MMLPLSSPSALAKPAGNGWIQAYEMSPAAYAPIAPPPGMPKEFEKMFDQTPVRGTLRSRLAVFAAGNRLRVRISNEEGRTPLVVGGASIARAAGEMDAVPGTMRQLTFGGKPTVTIAPGAPVLSDSVDLPVKAMDELVASVFVDENMPAKPRGGVTLFKSAGNDVLATTLPAAQPQSYRPLVSGVLVEAERPTKVIVAFGDSITDGGRASPSEPHGWADRLARRLVARKGSADYAVVTAGIGGNKVLMDGWGASALARADRDVFSVPGVTHVIFLEGINDIGAAGKTIMGDQPELDVDALIAAFEQIAVRAHARGLKIYVGTLTPMAGSFYGNDAKEKQRLAVNAWIRSSQVFDGVVDFDAAVRNPASPDQLKAEYDSGDHLHPGPAGYAAMGDAIDLKLFN